MKGKFLSFILISLLIFSFSPQTRSSSEDFEDLRKLEGFLNKNKTSMQKVGRGKYSVSDNQFNVIFPPCALAQGIDVNTAVGLIENEFTDINSGETVIGMGTGTVIKNTLDKISVITAKHVLEKKGAITFTLGSCLVMPGSDQITSLAKYSAYKVLFHNSEDVAIAKFRVIEKHLADERLRTFTMPLNHTPINNKKAVTIYHYPFGIEIQRLNKGFILAGNNNHTIPTLGGSSGAPIIYNGQIIGIHGGAHEFEGGTAEFRSEIEEFVKHNYYVKLSQINVDFSDFTKRS